MPVSQIHAFTNILPTNIHLLTVEPVSEYQFLLRLEHFYEKGDDPVLSLPVKISLEVCLFWNSTYLAKSLSKYTMAMFTISKTFPQIFQELKSALPFIKAVKETTLGGNQWIEESKRFDWIPRSDQTVEHSYMDDSSSSMSPEENVILLRPMEIKTFLIST